eukprot:CAMPEP_0175072802 /NCGR_PEP_ID=MMETSP0052_2-20121109/20139_1 /TAXON_ID=51329 ORGANISM="Polytomella parva, Strain SAG 63-3" /NCGR_SAMPLE_ID=MMETSP0052_2 /ASSEMBLY_ACC=CAM_ASM_000194 /LENGTH=55 /DNA_ID=CAMNT_0016340401 /DNA_START=226 /DNA_END=393 /DNA_ORIENTATION=+
MTLLLLTTQFSIAIMSIVVLNERKKRIPSPSLSTPPPLFTLAKDRRQMQAHDFGK